MSLGRSLTGLVSVPTQKMSPIHHRIKRSWNITYTHTRTHTLEKYPHGVNCTALCLHCTTVHYAVPFHYIVAELFSGVVLMIQYLSLIFHSVVAMVTLHHPHNVFINNHTTNHVNRGTHVQPPIMPRALWNQHKMSVFYKSPSFLHQSRSRPSICIVQVQNDLHTLGLRVILQVRAYAFSQFLFFVTNTLNRVNNYSQYSITIIFFIVIMFS